MFRTLCLGALLVGVSLLAGCGNGNQAAKGIKPPPPEVEVAQVIVRDDVMDFEIFTGRTDSSQNVEIRAKASGYLEKVHFIEGAIVKKGDLLATIDQRPYRAELTKSQANLTQARAHLTRMDRELGRAERLMINNANSREEYEKILGDRDEARALVGVAESNVELANLNLQYTEVRAPFSGRIGRLRIHPGSLIKADDMSSATAVLTNLIAIDPMYAYFDVDERTLLRQLLRTGLLESAENERAPVQIGFADEDGFPHAGVVNFIDNNVDSRTGTMWMRAEFTITWNATGVSRLAGLMASPQIGAPNGAALLGLAGLGEVLVDQRPVKPGIFIKVRFPLGKPYRSVLVAEQALASDQGKKYVFVVDQNNKAQYRQVQIGRLHDGLRVINSGLKEDDWVVVSGLQRVRSGEPIRRKEVSMYSRVSKVFADDDSPSDILGAPSKSPPANSGKSNAVVPKEAGK